jgi:hypothetical protein
MDTQPSIKSVRMAARMIISFTILSPFITFGLIVFKGLPGFAANHVIDVLIWVYHVTWVPALLSGVLLWLLLRVLQPHLAFFTKPYDLGRCFSLGAISGGIADAFFTWGWRAISHHPFSSFWIAGATLSGSIAGAILLPGILRTLSKPT